MIVDLTPQKTILINTTDDALIPPEILVKQNIRSVVHYFWDFTAANATLAPGDTRNAEQRAINGMHDTRSEVHIVMTDHIEYKIDLWAVTNQPTWVPTTLAGNKQAITDINAAIQNI